jgi:hypothetical protein
MTHEKEYLTVTGNALNSTDNTVVVDIITQNYGIIVVDKSKTDKINWDEVKYGTIVTFDIKKSFLRAYPYKANQQMDLFDESI